MTSGGVTQTVTRPGFFVQTGSSSTPPTQPAKASAALTDGTNADLDQQGRPERRLVESQPTDQQAAANNIGTTNSVAAPLIITPTAVKTTTVVTAAAQSRRPRGPNRHLRR